MIITDKQKQIIVKALYSAIWALENEIIEYLLYGAEEKEHVKQINVYKRLLKKLEGE